MLAVAMDRVHKKPFLTLEVGWNQNLYTEWYEETLAWIRNVMRYFGLLTSDLVQTEDRQRIYDKRVFIRTEFAWSINFAIDFNSQIHCGDTIWSIFDPLTQKISDIVSDYCWVLLSKWEVNQIPQDVTMYSVLVSSQCWCHQNDHRHN
jgi:predicted deacylase